MTTTTPAAGDALTARALRLAGASQKSVLDPVERFSEIIFGLVMVLGFTCTISVAEGGRESVRQMLVAALGCNLAWGLIDGVMYVVTSLVGRARRHAVLEGIREAGPDAARAITMAALPEGLAALVDGASVDQLVARCRTLPAARRPRLEWGDLRGAVASCLLVLVATLPPVLPFAFVTDVGLALRLSNGVAVVSLFLAGFSLGRATGVRPWPLGLGMVVLGAGLVGLTIALGG